jgi:hypothetical protein
MAAVVNLKYIRKLESEIKNMTSGGCLIVGVVIENGKKRENITRLLLENHLQQKCQDHRRS